jgi:chromate reductase
MGDVRVLLISGSTRTGSSNTRALRHMHEITIPGISSELYGDLVGLPAFVPNSDPVPDAVRNLLTRIIAADAVVFSTPEYAGGLPGALKNLLDWTVGGGELYGKPVAWLDVANPGRGGGARAQLRTVLGYVGAHVVDAACVRITLDNNKGAATTEGLRQLARAGAALVAAIAKERDRHDSAG